MESTIQKMEFILTTPRGPVTEVFHEPPKVDSFVERHLVRAVCGYILRRGEIQQQGEENIRVPG